MQKSTTELTTDLVLFDNARRAVAECVKVDEVKKLRDKAIMLEEYGRRAKDPQIMKQGLIFRMHATRRVGELIVELRKAGLLHVGGRPAKKPHRRDNAVKVKTLEELGISNHLANVGRKAAQASESDYQASLERKLKALENDVEFRAARKRKTKPPPPEMAEFMERLVDLCEDIPSAGFIDKLTAFIEMVDERSRPLNISPLVNALVGIRERVDRFIKKLETKSQRKSSTRKQLPKPDGE